MTLGSGAGGGGGSRVLVRGRGLKEKAMAELGVYSVGF